MLRKMARYVRDFVGDGRDEGAIQEWVLMLARPDAYLGRPPKTRYLSSRASQR